MSGLEMPWIKNDRVQRGRFKYDADEGVISSRDYAAKHRQPSKRSDAVASPFFMPDIAPFHNVAHPKDDHEISSRSHLRAFERDFQCYQCGGDVPLGSIAEKHDAELAASQKLAEGVEGGWIDLD